MRLQADGTAWMLRSRTDPATTDRRSESMTAPVLRIRGVRHYTVGVIARLLHTTPTRVRALIGDGTLWNQARVNGPIGITVESVR